MKSIVFWIVFIPLCVLIVLTSAIAAASELLYRFCDMVAHNVNYSCDVVETWCFNLEEDKR